MINVLNYGVKKNSDENQAQIVQEIMDACKETGGSIYFPSGKYTLGTIKIYSNIHVHFEDGTEIHGSTNLNDFNEREQLDYELYQDASHSYFERSLFWAKNAENISFEGKAKIDMQSVWEDKPTPGESAWCEKRAAKIFAFKNCKNISLKEMNLLNSTDVAIYFAGCEKVLVDGLKLDVHIDGISPDCCENVIISNCDIRSGDDGIVLKSSYTLNKRACCRDICITNCIVSSGCNAIKLGTESNGGFNNITISNCSIYDTYYSGIALEVTDGGSMDGVMVSNINMRNTNTPIFVILSDRRRGPDGTDIGSIQNISISNIVATGPYKSFIARKHSGLLEGDIERESLVLPSSVTGQPNKKIRDVQLSNILINTIGGGKEEDKKIVLPEITNKYPENLAFGETFPCYGFYFRHVENIAISNVNVYCEIEDKREKFTFIDVDNIQLN